MRKKINKKKFFELYRRNLDKDGILKQREVNALNSFLDLYNAHKSYFTLEQWAYVFATTFHETAHTFEPVKEAYWLSEKWRRNNLRYYPYYGRGFVQITWKTNYQKFSKLVGVDLVKHPSQALDTGTSFFILIRGMKEGLFTGRRLDRYVNSKRKRYDLARYVVNGRDRRDLIASYAERFEYILKVAS